MKTRILFLFFLFICQNSSAQLSVTANSNATQLAQLLTGAGVKISNAHLSCPSQASGSFTAAGTNLGMAAGIILTSGLATNAIGPNALGSTSNNNLAYGDTDLNTLVFPDTTRDACSLEFDVLVKYDTLVFKYVFGSEEYEEFVNSFNDVFGLFISGPGIVGKKNIAIIPNTNSIVSIDSVNCGSHANFYICNNSASIGSLTGCTALICPASNASTTIEYDGFTKVLEAHQAVQRCKTYHIKLAVADVKDQAYDSGIFIEAGSLSSSGVVVSAGVVNSNYENAVEGCINGAFNFSRKNKLSDTLTLHINIGGQATNGVDYSHVSDSVVFYPGDTLKTINIIPFRDNLKEGIESIWFQLYDTFCSKTFGDTVYLYIQDQLKVNAGNDTTICQTPFYLNATALGYIPPPVTICGITNAPCGSAITNLQAGNGIDTLYTVTPFNGNYQDSRMLLVFSKAELNTAGLNSSGILSSLSLDVYQKTSFFPYINFTIKVGCANSPAPALPNQFPIGLTQVYNSSYTPTLGWNQFAFTSNYNWDGINGLYVEICYDNTLNSNNDVVLKNQTSSNSVMMAYNDFATGCALSYAFPNITYSGNLRPNIKFGYCTPKPSVYDISWSPTANIIGTNITSAPKCTISSGTINFVATVNNIPGCPSTDTVKVTYIPPFTLTVSNDTSVCLNQPVLSWVNGGNNYTWSSLHNSTLSCKTCNNPTLTITHSTDSFLVRATNLNGCSILDTVIITQLPSPTSAFTISDDSICSADSILINYIGGLNGSGMPAIYTWNFSGAVISKVSSTEKYKAQWLNKGISDSIKIISLSVAQGTCISNSTIDTVVIHPIPTALVTVSPSTVCSGSYLNVDAKKSRVNKSGGNIYYTWNYNTGITKTGGNVISDSVKWNISDSISHIYKIYLQIIQDGCLSAIDSSAAVFINPNPTANFVTNPDTLCTNQISQFFFNGKTNSLGGTIKLTWNYNSGIVVSGDKTVKPKVEYSLHSGAGSTVFQPTLIVEQDGCISPMITQSIKVYANPTATIIGEDEICAGDSAVLCIQPANFKTYLWSTAETTPSIQPQQTDRYSVIFTDIHSCVDSTYKYFKIQPLPTAIATAPLHLIYLGNTIELDGSKSLGCDKFMWLPSANIENNTAQKTIATPTAITTFILKVTNDKTGCSDTTTLLIEVKNCMPAEFPNAFSPNGDGIDDFFTLVNQDDIYELTSFSIFNRWGERVFQTKEKNAKGWDGTFKGEPQEIGTYVYQVTFRCGGKSYEHKKGDFILLR